MKIVYVTPFLRVPPDFGLAIRNYHLLKYLAAQHAVILMTYENENQGEMETWARRELSGFISLGPYPVSASASGRKMFFKRLTKIVPGALARVKPRELAQSIHMALAQQPETDVVILDTHLIAQASLYLESKRALIIPVLIDVYTRYAQRQFASLGWRPYKLLYGLDWLRMYAYEKRMLAHSERIITVSETDAAWFRRHAPHAQVFVSPNGVDTSYFVPQQQSHFGKNLIYVGNFAYPPNEDGFFFFIREILPRIRESCPAHFFAVGLAPTPAMLKAAAADAAITVTGAVPDVRAYYALADVAVVPLRVGSGTKLKLIEALAMGLPVVSTPVGAEGFELSADAPLRVADSARAFADAVVALLKDPAPAHTWAVRARKVALGYDWHAIGESFSAYLCDALENKKTFL